MASANPIVGPGQHVKSNELGGKQLAEAELGGSCKPVGNEGYNWSEDQMVGRLNGFEAGSGLLV